MINGSDQTTSPSEVSSHERLLLAQAETPVGLAIVNLDGHWVDVNDPLTKMLGRSRQELLTLTFSDVTHPDDVDENLAGLQRLRDGDIDSYATEKRYLHRDGNVIWAQLSVTLVKDDLGKPLYFISQMQDVSERRRATDLLDLMFMSSPDLLCIANFEGYFLRVNPAWTRVLGWTEQEMTSTPFVDFVHPDDLVDTTKEYREVRSVSTGSEAFENRYRAKDGSYHWLQWNSITLHDRGWIVSNARDVTDQRRQAVELQRSNADLANFAAIISHDAKSPLSTIAGYTKLVQDTLRDRGEAQLLPFLDTVRNSCDRLSQLIDGVLAYSRAGAIGEFSSEEVAMMPLINEVLEDSSIAIMTAGATLSVEYLPPVIGDRVQLRQILQNLLANALKFGKTDQRLAVSIYADVRDNETRIAVEDNGIGMTAEDCAHAFEVFRQGESGIKRGGVGLGLATCQRLVERHGGKTWIDSEVGRGTTVWFTIPTGISMPISQRPHL